MLVGNECDEVISNKGIEKPCFLVKMFMNFLHSPISVSK